MRRMPVKSGALPRDTASWGAVCVAKRVYADVCGLVRGCCQYIGIASIFLIGAVSNCEKE